MSWDQVLIFGSMVPAIWLLARGSRWGNPVALLAQPAYFYTTWVYEQWGMFALTAWFTWCFAWGTCNNFWRKNV